METKTSPTLEDMENMLKINNINYEILGSNGNKDCGYFIAVKFDNNIFSPVLIHISNFFFNLDNIFNLRITCQNNIIRSDLAKSGYHYLVGCMAISFGADLNKLIDELLRISILGTIHIKKAKYV